MWTQKERYPFQIERALNWRDNRSTRLEQVEIYSAFHQYF